MKKITIITLLFAAAASITAYAQEDTPATTFKRNTAYVGLGGYISLYSLNYDKVFNPEGYFKWSLSAGIGYDQERYSFSSTRRRTYVVPLGIYGLTGKRNSHIEAGISLEPAILSYRHDNSGYYSTNSLYNGTYFSGVLRTGIGYRYQRPTGGLFFAVRTTWFLQGYYSARDGNKLRNPGEYYKFSKYILPDLKLAIGYTFK